MIPPLLAKISEARQTMKTTLNLDADIAAFLQEQSRIHDKPLQQVVNETLRLAVTRAPKRTTCRKNSQHKTQAGSLGYALIMIAAAMFLIPMIAMLLIAGLGMEIPPFILHNGGWIMAFGLITAGIGATIAWFE